MSKANKEQVLAKIEFLERQLCELNHYLPDTVDYLLKELDQQQRILAELEVNDRFAVISRI